MGGQGSGYRWRYGAKSTTAVWLSWNSFAGCVDERALSHATSFALSHRAQETYTKEAARSSIHLSLCPAVTVLVNVTMPLTGL
jgi:uncharacterized PurR-regulated membrane protein YhhQ (DUF165 family)